MSAGTATGLIIGASIAAGASTAVGVYGAKKASDTAKQASQVQVDASNKAMAYQQQAQQNAMNFINQQQSRPLQPMGGAAFNQLSSRTGGGGYGGLMGGQAPGGPPGAPPPSQMPPSPAGGYQTLLGPSTGIQPPSLGASGPPMGGMPPSAPGASSSGNGMVMLEAPTGERQAVPEAQAAALIARGARRV